MDGIIEIPINGMLLVYLSGLYIICALVVKRIGQLKQLVKRYEEALDMVSRRENYIPTSAELLDVYHTHKKSVLVKTVVFEFLEIVLTRFKDTRFRYRPLHTEPIKVEKD
jgi:hypothetical protein